MSDRILFFDDAVLIIENECGVYRYT
ncbi:Protein of unknown function [Bacillus mycoides]|nr:Protein of unknown function [Bacillus mycoides]